MISFKQYRLLNENIGHAMPVGVSSRQSINQLTSRWDEHIPKVIDDQPEEEEETILKKKPIPHDHDEEDEDLDHDEDDEEDEDDHDEDDHDDDEDEEEVDKIKKPLPMPQQEPMPNQSMMMKKGMKKESTMGYMKKGMKKKNHEEEACGCKKCASEPKMKKENSEFLASLKRQLGKSHFNIHPNGSPIDEDAILPPTDPNAGLTEEPTPGQPGFAPQTRIGSGFNEWAKKYK